MCGVVLLLLLYLAIVGLWLLLIIALEWHDFIFSNAKTMSLAPYKHFTPWLELNFSAKVQILRSNNGGRIYQLRISELLSPTRSYLWNIMCQTPHQNGIAERKNRHILETACTLLIGAHVPRHHWDHAVATFVYWSNCMPTKVLEFMTPLKVLAKHVSLPCALMIPPWIFGCVAFVQLHKNQHTKLDMWDVCCPFWVMPYIRKVINVTNLTPNAHTSLWILHSYNQTLSFHPYMFLLLRGRLKSSSKIGRVWKGQKYWRSKGAPT